MMLNKLLPKGSKRRNIAIKVYKFFVKYTDEELIYKKWINQNEPNKAELARQRDTKFGINPKISIVVPVYNTPEKFFAELVDSLNKQTYSNWELCLADGSPKKLDFIEKYIEKNNKIKYKFIGENKGISGNTNEALSLVTGDYIGLLDHDDLLPAFSLYEVVKRINENPKAEFIYSDEDKLETKIGPRYGVFFKPDFSPYTLNSANYICHFSIFKKELMDKLVGFRSEYDGSQDFDIVARASELTNSIEHISKVLYHWRAHKNSTAQNSDSKPYAFEVGKNVIKDHIKRSLDKDVIVSDGLTPGSYEIKYIPKEKSLISIILDCKELEKNGILDLIEKVKSKTDYENYEIIVVSDTEIEGYKNIKNSSNIFKSINENSNLISGKYFIILDSDLIDIDRISYLEDLLGIAEDSNVGIVGTKEYDENDLILHSGIILGMNGVGDFLYKGAPKNAGTYMQRLLIIHNVSCVYLKYSLINKELFTKLEGFSNFTGITESIDYSLKILSDNKQVVINPIISFKLSKLSDAGCDANEIEEVMKKWKKEYEKGDIYFSPNLSKTNTGLSFNV